MVFVFLQDKDHKQFIILSIFIAYLLSILGFNYFFDDLPEVISYAYLGFIISIFNHFWIGYYAFTNIKKLDKDISTSFIFINIFILFWMIQGGFNLNILFGQSLVSYLLISELYLLIAGLFICLRKDSNLIFFIIPFSLVIQFILYSRSAIVGFLIMTAFVIIISKIRFRLILLSFFLIIIASTYIDYLQISSFERQLTLFSNIMQNSSVILRLELFEKFPEVFLSNPLAGDLGWHLDYYGKEGYYIHSYLSYLTSFGLFSLFFLIYFFSESIKNLFRDHNFSLLPIFFAFIVIVLIAKAWMYTSIWFLVGLLLANLKRE